ncbi:hypothetical protein E4U21_004150 [Claviceps maximensis]|nr:hypothetical protein E4U21_004150 [Claviceps maximensis]
MDYFLKKAVESVKKRRRSREEIAADVSIEQNLHLAAMNCIFNIDSTRRGSAASDDSATSTPSLESIASTVDKPASPSRGSHLKQQR